MLNMISVMRAAQHLGVTRGRIYQMIREGEIPARRLDGSATWLIDPKWLRKHEQPPKVGRPRGGRKA